MPKLWYTESVDGVPVSWKLHNLLDSVHGEVNREKSDLPKLKESLERLLVFLGSAGGRTNANCCATDSFFSDDENWPVGWAHLPDAFGEILSDLGGCLHDTVTAPEIAKNFESTPEQLLERVRKISLP